LHQKKYAALGIEINEKRGCFSGMGKMETKKCINIEK
jgi:hypothetical protein